MANKEQLAIIKQGVTVWNEWREKSSEAQVDLHGANLHGANLHGANLHGANLNMVDLGGAHLQIADLTNADLTKANLQGAHLLAANFLGAKLVMTDLGGADLLAAYFRKATLKGANLAGANLNWATLSEANLGKVVLDATLFANNDLSTVRGLKTIVHAAPSEISISTIYKSKGIIPEVFLRGCGIPDDMIAYVRSLRGKRIKWYSCFISHSAKDKPFVERLYNDLKSKGVRTYYFPKDATSGRKVWGEIDESISNYDKTVVVCSKNSLQSEPVIREIERALNREAKDHKDVLFPITLDRYIFDAWEHELKADLLRKVIGDFSGSSRSVPKYTKAFDKLLKDLQKE